MSENTVMAKEVTSVRRRVKNRQVKKPQSTLESIRRDLKNHTWVLADEVHRHFKGSIKTGLLIEVEFLHNAPPMQCEPGYDSTGEARGQLVAKTDYIAITSSNFSPDKTAEMPADAVHTAEIVYDREARRFHMKGKSQVVLSTAHYLLLKEDGIAIVGWRS
ncbi:MAG: hypothetical protein WC761_07105 [Candidatus Paceibacterota bacterium]|jgi:hypothetical protein